MSEYQYYEFRAIDRPLSLAEMAKLRAVSTRAEITASGFVNHYEWGDLKADPSAWMRRYFDAFVYTANWASCRLALRVPLAAFGLAEIKPFKDGECLSITASDTHWIIDWQQDGEDDERFEMDDGRGWMSRLAPLREELLCGDLRALYLGWLAGVAGAAFDEDADGDGDDAALEPPVPPGLSALTAPQQALVEFLQIDADMLAAAVAGSAPLSPVFDGDAGQLDAWLGEWSPGEMAAILKLIAQGQGFDAERQVKARHAAWLKARRPPSDSQAQPRSVGALRELAQQAQGVRLAHEAHERALQKAEKRRQHEAHLRRLMADVTPHWAAIEVHAQRGTAASYEKAASALAELAQGYDLTASREAFDHALRHWLVPHAKRGALLRRLTGAGLL